MRYEEMQGSEEYVRRLVEVSTELNNKDGDFVLVPPGEEIQLSQFLR
jgi:hypothetical protein